MRKWHRWIALVSGVFMLWMAVTGLAIHTTQLLRGAGEHHEAGAPSGAAAKPAFTCPPDYLCRPRPKDGPGSLVGFFQHLHSGETFGPVGTLISILAGVALLFFAVSGIWLYAQMWANRRKRALKPGWFWK